MSASLAERQLNITPRNAQCFVFCFAKDIAKNRDIFNIKKDFEFLRATSGAFENRWNIGEWHLSKNVTIGIGGVTHCDTRSQTSL